MKTGGSLRLETLAGLDLAAEALKRALASALDFTGPQISPPEAPRRQTAIRAQLTARQPSRVWISMAVSWQPMRAISWPASSRAPAMT